MQYSGQNTGFTPHFGIQSTLIWVNLRGWGIKGVTPDGVY